MRILQCKLAYMVRVHRIIERRINNVFDHELYGLQPDHPFSKGFVSINDDLTYRIMTGQYTAKPRCSDYNDVICIIINII